MLSYIYVCNLPLRIFSSRVKAEQLECCTVICFEKVDFFLTTLPRTQALIRNLILSRACYALWETSCWNSFNKILPQFFSVQRRKCSFSTYPYQFLRRIKRWGLKGLMNKAEITIWTLDKSQFKEAPFSETINSQRDLKSMLLWHMRSMRSSQGSTWPNREIRWEWSESNWSPVWSFAELSWVNRVMLWQGRSSQPH